MFRGMSLLIDQYRYNWSPIPHNTMKVERDFVTNENDAKINWDYNGATTYSVVNKDEKNQYGEYRGYTVEPGMYLLCVPQDCS